MLRIAFAGTPAFAVPALDALAASSHQLVGVLTQPDRPAGRGRQLAASAVKQRALVLGLPVAQPARLTNDEQRAPLRDWQPDLLVVVAYGLILPPAVLELPRLGCINIHASLLPRWRGAAPIQRAILAGDRETGVCIMRLEAGLDTGPVFETRRLPIDERSTAGELQDSLAVLGAAALMQVVTQLEAGEARAQPQRADGVTYAEKIEKREAAIDWNGDATQIARQVRAFNPWPVAETRWRGQQLRIWRAHCHDHEPRSPAAPGAVLGMQDGALQVQCGHGLLAVSSLQLAGRKQLGAEEFSRSQQLVGQQLG